MKLRPAGAIAIVLLAAASGGCGNRSNAALESGATRTTRGGDRAPMTLAVAPRVASRRTFGIPFVRRPSHLGRAWQTTANIDGRPAVWIARRSGVTLLRFDQGLVHLALHAGLGEPRGRHWRYGDRIGGSEIHRVVAAFNGGFKLLYGSVGFMANGRVAVALGTGLGSIVTYDDGATEIGAWRRGVPAPGRAIASVLQNLRLLIDHGVVAPTVKNCVIVCWGKTLGGRPATARTALGVTGSDQLVWAAGESLTPNALAHALIGAGVVRAVELDINPGWVAGYLYVHHRGTGPTPVAALPGQLAIPNRLLRPYNRDFFTVLAN